ncbi:M24 family metallopeptidase [Stakelama tenebrarum]|uniref:Aminopeptidase P family protein n=1 Tax=Stakelama tenebrarum TaxID=2711215 RepID=A0A6G6Y623_9SPHN|nr:Xaa-Pro peptidase family protein [Sphingosinithalassobacter tenebrarum]QIG80033.1 aminopeptidase P family protein [Sphingosinithalassobacter tenebrarum]
MTFDLLSPRFSRRSLLAAGAMAPLLATPLTRALAQQASELPNLAANAVEIGPEERAARIARAQALMQANDIGSIVIEPGGSMVYFSGVRWWRSERLTALVIPQEGQPCIVTPFFEEPSVRESLGIPAEIREWQEDQDPTAVVAGFLKDRGIDHLPVGIEESVRYFAVAGLGRALPDAKLVPGNAVVRGCRMIKTPAELALMQTATDITIAAYRWTYPQVEAGMTPRDIGALMTVATRAMGGSVEFNLILLGEASAYPHGSGQPQMVREGEVVLMDCGCSVHDYESDVSRTFVYGDASAEQRKVWGEVHRGQQIAFEAAQVGTPAGQVDDAVRRYYDGLGYGPGYALPGLSHRTGHGIGLEGHEPVNFVRGEQTPLAPGMCFSDEPGIYMPGKFGVRLEDCIHVTEAGPKWFSEPPVSIDEPFR